jgi:hypothetical protein
MRYMVNRSNLLSTTVCKNALGRIQRTISIEQYHEEGKSNDNLETCYSEYYFLIVEVVADSNAADQ